MRHVRVLLAAFVMLLGSIGTAQATTFQLDDYWVKFHDSDPGLVLWDEGSAGHPVQVLARLDEQTCWSRTCSASAPTKRP